MARQKWLDTAAVLGSDALADHTMLSVYVRLSALARRAQTFPKLRHTGDRLRVILNLRGPGQVVAMLNRMAAEGLVKYQTSEAERAVIFDLEVLPASNDNPGLVS